VTDLSTFHPNDPGITERATGAVHLDGLREPGRMAVGRATLHRLPRYDDPRGTVVVNQAPDQLPFVPRRVFHVFNVPEGEMRGDHAHRRCHQFIMAISGSVVVVVDDTSERFSIRLDSPDQGLHIPPLVWSIQRDFEPDAQVMVFASEPYDRSEYIDDFDEFTGIVAAGPGHDHD
jgi:UDP-2-acetamido-3-amino-2,3-dideoxy-glucuronate N-acetyltransferase